jgi:deoxyribodipyrimidine photo-lyase
LQCLVGAGPNARHQPWSATPLELKAAGVELGKTYPEPIIAHRLGRERALKAYASIRAR